MKTTLIVPALNEKVGLQAIMPRVKPEWCQQVIIMDGGSNDGTADEARRMGYEVFTACQRGLWNEYREVFMSGMVKGDIVITFSPDGNSLPEGIPILAQAVELLGYDMVIGSRYACGARSADDTKLTRIGNWLLTKIVNVVCGGRYTDALVMLRAYRKEIIDKLGFTKETPRIHRWAQGKTGLASWEPPMSIRASKAKLKIGEIPIEEPPAYRERNQNTFTHGFILLAQILYEGLFRRSK